MAVKAVGAVARGGLKALNFTSRILGNFTSLVGNLVRPAIPKVADYIYDTESLAEEGWSTLDDNKGIIKIGSDNTNYPLVTSKDEEEDKIDDNDPDFIGPPKPDDLKKDSEPKRKFKFSSSRNSSNKGSTGLVKFSGYEPIKSIHTSIDIDSNRMLRLAQDNKSKELKYSDFIKTYNIDESKVTSIEEYENNKLRYHLYQQINKNKLLNDDIGELAKFNKLSSERYYLMQRDEITKNYDDKLKELKKNKTASLDEYKRLVKQKTDQLNNLLVQREAIQLNKEMYLKNMNWIERALNKSFLSINEKFNNAKYSLIKGANTLTKPVHAAVSGLSKVKDGFKSKLDKIKNNDLIKSAILPSILILDKMVSSLKDLIDPDYYIELLKNLLLATPEAKEGVGRLNPALARPGEVTPEMGSAIPKPSSVKPEYYDSTNIKEFTSRLVDKEINSNYEVPNSSIEKDILEKLLFDGLYNDIVSGEKTLSLNTEGKWSINSIDGSKKSISSFHIVTPLSLKSRDNIKDAFDKLVPQTNNSSGIPKTNTTEAKIPENESNYDELVKNSIPNNQSKPIDEVSRSSDVDAIPIPEDPPFRGEDGH